MVNEARGQQRPSEPLRSMGNDEVPVPGPVNEVPPFDRYCDIVLTGGVASGVVYPWAIVELARVFRFRNIGGASVGAMAAALAAAAEYGRSNGFEAPFEVLRRLPGTLAFELPDGRTRMLSLFQPTPRGQRLVDLWGRVFNGNADAAQAKVDDGGTNQNKPSRQPRGLARRAASAVAELFLSTLLCGALFGVFLTKLVALLCVGLPWAHWPVGLFFLAFVMAMLSAAVALLAALWSDIRWGLIDNRYGLCKGNTVARPGDPAWLTGLSEWLHDGIQLSAGLKRSDPPLTFRDLWQAPSHPGAAPRPCKSSDPPERRTINLQMLTTNVTHGRPYRLPLTDRSSRLFFRRSEWEGYFPTGVLNALESHAIPYAPRDGSGSEPAADHPSARDLLELPVEDLPVVVAARLSLSFPLLFSAVPLWAIDFEALPKHRTMKCCLFTDGGVSSNFPIHLFDAAVPRWPTFGFWLDRHPPYKYKVGEDDVWLPKTNGQGRGDNWDRFDPASKAIAEPSLNGVDGLLAKPTTSASDWTAQLSAFFGYLLGIGVSTKDWRDRSNMRMTHVRNRVVRLMLRSDEGNLNIGMPGKQLLDMAHRYGTQAGKAFVDRFGDKDGQPSQAWSEQRWVRMNVLLNGLRELLTGMSAAVGWSLRTVPLDQAISAAARNGPVRNARTDPGRDHLIAGEQVPDLKQLLADIQRLEMALRATRPAFESSPNPELRLRPPF